MAESVRLRTDGSGASPVAAVAGLTVAAQFDAAVHVPYVTDERQVLTPLRSR